MKERIEELAEMVLDMRARQDEYYRLAKVYRHGRKVDGERLEELFYEMRKAQAMVEEECRDILGIEEE